MLEKKFQGKGNDGNILVFSTCYSKQGSTFVLGPQSNYGQQVHILSWI